MTNSSATGLSTSTPAEGCSSRALQPEQHTVEPGLVVHGRAEAAEQGGDGPDRGEPVSADSCALATFSPSIRGGSGRNSTL